MKKIIPISLILILIDQIIKIIITNKLELLNSIIIIKNFFNITHVNNYGAAWSIMSGNRILLISIAIITLILIYYFLIRNKKLTSLDIISYSMLISGIIGNLADRIIHGFVIDYLDFNIFGYGFPIFNFADMMIVISVLLIIISILK